MKGLLGLVNVSSLNNQLRVSRENREPWEESYFWGWGDDKFNLRLWNWIWNSPIKSLALKYESKVNRWNWMVDKAVRKDEYPNKIDTGNLLNVDSNIWGNMVSSLLKRSSLNVKVEKKLSHMSFFAFTFPVPFTLRILLTWLFKDSLEGRKKKRHCQNRAFFKKTEKKIGFFFFDQSVRARNEVSKSRCFSRMEKRASTSFGFHFL